MGTISRYEVRCGYSDGTGRIGVCPPPKEEGYFTSEELSVTVIDDETGEQHDEDISRIVRVIEGAKPYLEINVPIKRPETVGKMAVYAAMSLEKQSDEDPESMGIIIDFDESIKQLDPEELIF